MSGLKTVILAAGKGTRMKSERPKVLHEVNGRVVLDYVLDVSKSVGSLKTYIVLGYKADEVKGILPKGIDVVLQKKLLGTADAVKCAAGRLKSFNGDILIMCGDTPMLTKDTIKALIRKHKQKKAVCTVLTCVVGNPNGYGRIIRDQDGKVVAIREDKDAEGLERSIAEINVGVYCFSAKAMRQGLKQIGMNKKKKEFYFTDIIELLSEDKQRIESFETEDATEGLGINTREDLANADRILKMRVIKSLMSEGVTVLDPTTTFIQHDVRIGRDTIIYPFTVIEQNVKIGNHCKVGPFAHLRPGTSIGNKVEVGNFTEVSRARVGDHCFIKHFSFLGDANIGSHVNIGAGTVTANFDGVNKNKTTILNHAFIGSDSVLIAPVRIGKRAVVGAGSVVTKGKKVPDGCVAVGVPAVIKGKKR